MIADYCITFLLYYSAATTVVFVLMTLSKVSRTRVLSFLYLSDLTSFYMKVS
jgi:hypothetical protein